MDSGAMVIVDREKKAIVLRIDNDQATPNDLDTIKIARGSCCIEGFEISSRKRNSLPRRVAQ